MPAEAPPKTHWSIDALLALALLVVVAMVVPPALDGLRQRDRMRAVRAEARNIQEGFRRYYEKYHVYPADEVTRPFQSDVLGALERAGYYKGEMREYLANGRVDAYGTPHDDGQGREYWLEMTLDADSTARILIAHSDDAPIGRGEWMDGAFLLKDGKVEPL
jgi:hypothetical protein